MKVKHAARPLPARGSGKPGIEPIYEIPFRCAVCNQPIEHRHAGAWRHVAIEHKGWRIFKEFYADGPSLFVWKAVSSTEVHEFRRRKDAIAYADEHPAMPGTNRSKLTGPIRDEGQVTGRREQADRWAR